MKRLLVVALILGATLSQASSQPSQGLPISEAIIEGIRDRFANAPPAREYHELWDCDKFFADPKNLQVISLPSAYYFYDYVEGIVGNGNPKSKVRVFAVEEKSLHGHNQLWDYYFRQPDSEHLIGEITNEKLSEGFPAISNSNKTVEVYMVCKKARVYFLEEGIYETDRNWKDQRIHYTNRTPFQIAFDLNYSEYGYQGHSVPCAPNGQVCVDPRDGAVFRILSRTKYVIESDGKAAYFELAK